MKLLIAIFLVSVSVSAQNIELVNELNTTPVVIENNSNQILEYVNVIDAKTIIVKKKSYKNIIEKTLSGEKFLIFKAKRVVKTC